MSKEKGAALKAAPLFFAGQKQKRGLFQEPPFLFKG